MTFQPVFTGTGKVAFDQLQRTRTQQLDRLRLDPGIARDIEHFNANIGKITSVDGLLGDRTILKVALSNFGLDEDINNGAFLRKVLESDLTDPRSFANRLADKRYAEFAVAFNFSSGSAQLPGEDNSEAIADALSSVRSADDLFKFRFRNLLDTALETFGLTDMKGQTAFLKNILESDVQDETSLVNRLEDKRFLAFAQAFQGVASPVPQRFLDKFDADTAAKLSTFSDADALINDTRTLKTVLETLGLSQFQNDQLFVKFVLESDLSDPKSLANRSQAEPLRELAEALDFNARAEAPVTIYDFARTFERRAADLETAEDLVNTPHLLSAALGVFGLEEDAKTRSDDFLISVLNSDTSDPDSVAQQEPDQRYLALSKAFAFGDILNGETQEEAQTVLQRMIDAARSTTTPPDTPDAFLSDIPMLFASMQFFDVPLDAAGFDRIKNIVTSDPAKTDQLFGVMSDKRYEALYDSLELQDSSASFQYPSNFAAVYTDNYLKSEFEDRVGEVDLDLRIALSLEDEFNTLMSRTKADAARWLTILGSGPLRAVMEGALGLPQGLSGLDPDRQVAEMQARAQKIFGTTEIEKLASPENLPTLRERYLNSTLINGGSGGAPVDASTASFTGALSILRGAGGSTSLLA